MLPPAFVCLIGFGMIIFGYAAGPAWLFWIGWAVAILALLVVGALAYSLNVPRLAYEDGYLLVYLRAMRPIRVPIEIVEVFFLGSGPAHLGYEDEHGPKTSNVVVRLAEAARDWRTREVRPELGEWYDSYIVIRGTWCEPLSLERINRINARLSSIKRRRRTSDKETT